MLDLMLSSLPPDSPKDPFTDISKEVVKKAKLKQSQWFILLVSIIFLAFILTYSYIPNLKAFIPLTKSDLRSAFWIVVIMAVGLCFAYAILDMIRDSKK